MTAGFQLVKRESIPSIRTVEQNGTAHSIGEYRDFRWNQDLRNFLEHASQFSISWAVLPHGEVLKAHVHPIQSMMVIYAGTGEVFGDLCRPLSAGEVLVVPAGCSHGFRGGPEGLHALTIQLGRGFYTNPDKPRISFLDEENSLKPLLVLNEKRLRQFAKSPIFDLLTDGTFEDLNKRRAYLSATQIWLDGISAVLVARQAGCANSHYEPAFMKQLQQELNSKFINGSPNNYREGGAPIRDALMEAFTGWFAYQMYVLDDVEKAAITYLVLERAKRALLKRAAPALEQYVGSAYFKAAAETEDPLSIGTDLLRNESPKTYVRLRRVIEESWDMIGAMSNRVVTLTQSA